MTADQRYVVVLLVVFSGAVVTASGGKYHGLDTTKDDNSEVTVPTATILEAPALYVDKGSTINLTCTIKYSPEPPAFIFWHHQDEVISYDSSRGGVQVITERGEVTTSYLLIQHAELTDSGKYSCCPSNADIASVRVYVLDGEKTEEMQTDSPGLINGSLNIGQEYPIDENNTNWLTNFGDF